MSGATMAYSPGYAVPLWLGSAQIRLWRHLDRVIGTRTYAATTVREIAAELGSNPGTISRDLDALGRLGFAVHDAVWGRRGVRLWRVASRGGRRGLDPRRARRALARMGILAAPGQMALSTADDRGPVRHGSPPTGAGTPPLELPAPVNHKRADSGAGAPGTGAGGTVEPPAPEIFTTVRCSCGRSRIVRVGVEPPPCIHPADRRTIWDPER